MSSDAQQPPFDLTRMARRVHGIGESIFSEMTRLAIDNNAVNLSQGFPDFPAPDWLKEAAREAIANNVNQYAPSHGAPRLRKAIIDKAERYKGIRFDANVELTVTNGATEAIFDVIQALVDPGDEVIVFEPYYDSYVPAIEIAGGTPRFVRLEPPDWHFDAEHLTSLFSEKTRAIIINTPHNPTGKMFNEDELSLIAGLCRRFEAIAITDEVYEHLIYNGNRHISIVTLPGMRDRTVTISSAAKTFSVTGWKVGYVLAAPDLTEALRRVHQFVTFCSVAPMQEAIALAIETAEERGYYDKLAAEYTARLDKLQSALEKADLRPMRPQGSFFIMSDISHLGFESDVQFARFVTSEVGVACIPPSAFYADPDSAPQLARWCFAKLDDTLEAAAAKLQQWTANREAPTR